MFELRPSWKTSNPKTYTFKRDVHEREIQICMHSCRGGEEQVVIVDRLNAWRIHYCDGLLHLFLLAYLRYISIVDFVVLLLFYTIVPLRLFAHIRS